MKVENKQQQAKYVGFVDEPTYTTSYESPRNSKGMFSGGRLFRRLGEKESEN
jgi:hypothetical protein